MTSIFFFPAEYIIKPNYLENGMVAIIKGSKGL